MVWLCVLLPGCGGAPARLPARVEPPPAAVAAPQTLDEKRALYLRARKAASGGGCAEAVHELEVLCPAYAEMEDYCLYLLGRCRAQGGDATGADAAWAQLASKYPQSLYAPRATLERGRLARQRGDLAAARALLTAAQAGGDKDVALRALIELSQVEIADGLPAAAQYDLMEVRRRSPGTQLGADAKSRLAALRRDHPELAPQGAALDAELRVLLAERDYPAARDAAQRLLLTAPAADRPELLRLRADAEIGAGQLDDGLATLAQIARDYPDSAAAPEALYRRATLLWNRDRDLEAEAAFVEFRHRYPGDPRTPDVLYALARLAEAEGHDDEAAAAYARLAEAYPASAVAREARWRAGWIRYRNGQYADAAATFQRAAAGAAAPAAADSLYWQARSLERAGNRGAADAIYRRLLAEAPASYYAYWAEKRLGRAPAHPAAPPPAPAAGGLGAAPPGTDSYHWVRARELQAMGLNAPARAELRAFERGTAGVPGATAPTLAAYQAAGGYRDAIRLAQSRGISDPAVLYPFAFWPQVVRSTSGSGVDPLLVLALMRQESLFDPEARSGADARGLMQLLPATAERTARANGRSSPQGKLYDPAVNITLGVAYLQQLLRAYNGDPLKALAAYNGGEAAVAKWEQRFGSLPADELVESITYRETRDYVKRVMGNYRRYRQAAGAGS